MALKTMHVQKGTSSYLGTMKFCKLDIQVNKFWEENGCRDPRYEVIYRNLTPTHYTQYHILLDGQKQNVYTNISKELHNKQD